MKIARALLVAAAVSAAALFAAACGSDVTTQPSADAPASFRFTPSPIGKFQSNLPASIYTATQAFTIDPSSDAYIQIGPHYLYIPAGAVCDPSTSGYGPSLWTASCSSTTQPITVTAHTYLQNNHPVIEFDTHLRFKPGPDGRYNVMLYLRDDNANAKSVITWCADSSSLCVDETKFAAGATLNTRFDPRGLYVYRKIQHFSGYNVTGGDDCDPTTTDCGAGQ